MQRKYFMVGFLLLLLFLVRLFLSLQTGDANMVELINWGSIVYMAFIIGYLYPQFKEKDERSNQIKQRGMYYTIFITLIALVGINLLIQYSILEISALEIVRIMISLVIITLWTAWLILSKRM